MKKDNRGMDFDGASREPGNEQYEQEDEVRHLRRTIEQLSDQMVRSKEREEKVLGEFSAMNNELVTLQRQLVKSNQELKQARRAAEAAHEAKSRLLATISHEIRTPMGGIIGIAELMDREALSAEDRSSLAVIRESADMLIAMMNDLLDLSKMEAGKMELNIGPVSIPSILNHAASLLGPKAEQNGNTLRIDMADGMDQPWLGDSRRLSQIIINLLGNANKFTKRGLITIRVSRLEETQQGCRVRFEVEDTGLGISAEDQSKLFEPYAQTEEGSAVYYGGTGLGLSICRSLVEQMQGRIGVNSELGQGSVFWFEVPLRMTATASEGERPALEDNSAHQAEGNAAVSSAAILIAEDNPLNQQVIRLQLKNLGYTRVTLVTNGEEACKAAEQGGFALILMDNEMPKLNGFEAGARIRQMEETCGLARVPMIAMTGSGSGADRDRGFAAGFDDYLLKPVVLQDLRSMLEKWIVKPPGSAELLDHSVLSDILDLEGDTDLLSTLLQMFMEEMPGKSDTLREQLGKNAFREAAATAHGMKSSSLSLGTKRLSALLGKIETASRQSSSSELTRSMEQLPEVYRVSCEALQQYLSAAQPGNQRL